MTDTTRTWTFAHDEGGTVSLTISDDEHTIDYFSGPDCDGASTEFHYVFVQRDPTGDYSHNTTVRTGPYVDDVTEVHVDDVQRGYDEWVDAELGSILRSHYLTGQPSD